MKQILIIIAYKSYDFERDFINSRAEQGKYNVHTKELHLID